MLRPMGCDCESRPLLLGKHIPYIANLQVIRLLIWCGFARDEFWEIHGYKAIGLLDSKGPSTETMCSPSVSASNKDNGARGSDEELVRSAPEIYHNQFWLNHTQVWSFGEVFRAAGVQFTLHAILSNAHLCCCIDALILYWDLTRTINHS